VQQAIRFRSHASCAVFESMLNNSGRGSDAAMLSSAFRFDSGVPGRWSEEVNGSSQK
jgi:hypothetical protein